MLQVGITIAVAFTYIGTYWIGFVDVCAAIGVDISTTLQWSSSVANYKIC